MVNYWTFIYLPFTVILIHEELLLLSKHALAGYHQTVKVALGYLELFNFHDKIICRITETEVQEQYPTVGRPVTLSLAHHTFHGLHRGHLLNIMQS